MRSFIIKNFALNHISVVFGKTINWVRIGNWAIPSMCVGGLWSIYTDMNFMNLVGILILLVILIQNLVVFVYFKYCPIKYEELTLSQRWQYSKAYFSGQLTNPLPKEEVSKVLRSWDNVSEEFELRLSRRFYNVGAFLIVPTTMLLTALLAVILF